MLLKVKYWIIFPPVSREQKDNLGHMLKAHLGHIGTYWKHIILYLHSLPAWAVFKILSNFPKIPIGAWLMTGSFTSNPYKPRRYYTLTLHPCKNNVYNLYKPILFLFFPHYLFRSDLNFRGRIPKEYSLPTSMVQWKMEPPWRQVTHLPTLNFPRFMVCLWAHY